MNLEILLAIWVVFNDFFENSDNSIRIPLFFSDYNHRLSLAFNPYWGEKHNFPDEHYLPAKSRFPLENAAHLIFGGQSGILCGTGRGEGFLGIGHVFGQEA